MNIITKVCRERVNFVVYTEKPVKKEAYLLNSNNKKFILPIRDGKIIINITNLSKGEMIEADKYSLFIDGEPAKAGKDVFKQSDNLTGVFKYREVYALIVEFKINEDDKSVYLDSQYYMKNRKYKRNFRLAQAGSLKGFLSVIFKNIFLFLLNLFYKFISGLRFFCGKRTLFFSQNCDEPEGNLKALYEYFLNNKLGNAYGFFYNKFRKNSVLSFIKSVIKVALSYVIVVDNYVPLFTMLKLRKEQKVIQLWHAGVGFKAVGYARFGEDGSPHPFNSAHRKYTDVIVDDERTIDVYKEVFACDDSIIKPLGMPRLDGYLTDKKIKAVTDKLYNINPDLKTKKVILFSPTYRGTGADNASYDYTQLDLKKIFEFSKENGFLFIIKMHPFIRESINIPKEYSKVIFDYSAYDINELIYVSDIMVTDYSSCAYEFSFFNRPLIFFRYDKDIYEYTRPVHTLDFFTKKQYEVTDFNALESTLKMLKDVKIEERFSDMRTREKDCCKKIADIILGEEK